MSKSMTKDAWTRLVAALDGSRAVRAAVAQAVDDPVAYVRAHVETLRERGVTAPIPELPLLALLDALDAEGRVALLDHRTASEDVVASLRGLKPRRKLAWAWLKAHDEDALDDLGLERLLAAIAAEALPPELALVNLDTRSDQMAILIVDAESAAELLAAAKGVRHPAKRVAPKVLAKPKAKPAATARSGEPMSEWPPWEADPWGTTRYFFHRERGRSLWMRRWESAFDVMEGPAWEWAMDKDHRDFDTSEDCARSYAAFVAELRRTGWLQFSEEESRRELSAQQAARKNRPRR